MFKIPSKFVWIAAGAVLIFIAGAFFLTPRQTRLGDDYRKADQIIPPAEMPAVKTPVALNNNIQIYYYAAMDKNCKSPVPVVLSDLDKRKSFEVITALHALLSHTPPEGYFSAFIESTTLNSFKISQGIATVDLSSFLTFGSGPCVYAARKAQLINTLSQFEEIKQIILEVDGKVVQ